MWRAQGWLIFYLIFFAHVIEIIKKRPEFIIIYHFTNFSISHVNAARQASTLNLPLEIIYQPWAEKRQNKNITKQKIKQNILKKKSVPIDQLKIIQQILKDRESQVAAVVVAFVNGLECCVRFQNVQYEKRKTKRKNKNKQILWVQVSFALRVE